jgi:hypothetical protein
MKSQIIILVVLIGISLGLDLYWIVAPLGVLLIIVLEKCCCIKCADEKEVE